MAVSTSYKRGGDFMSVNYILLLALLAEQGIVTSVTVSKSSVTIRIKK